MPRTLGQNGWRMMAHKISPCEGGKNLRIQQLQLLRYPPASLTTALAAAKVKNQTMNRQTTQSIPKGIESLSSCSSWFLSSSSPLVLLPRTIFASSSFPNGLPSLSFMPCKNIVKIVMLSVYLGLKIFICCWVLCDNGLSEMVMCAYIRVCVCFFI